MARNQSPDKSNNTQAKDLEDGDVQQSSFISTGDVAKLLDIELRKADYKLLPAKVGNLLAGHQPYKLMKLAVNEKVKVWRRLETELDFINFNNNFSACIKRVMDVNPDTCDTAIKISSAVLEQPKSKQTAFYNYGQAKADYTKDTGSRTFLGAEGVKAHKAIPMVHWFPELNDLNPLELLSLFPKPEARAMMLLLGRTVIGVGGTVTQEGTIEHKMRAAGIVVGLEPGLGKSTLLNYITNALDKLGYVSTPITNPGSRFGWGEIADADLAYRDDLTVKGQGQLLVSDDMKTIITGGNLPTENKGKDSVKTQAKATVVAFTNVYKREHFYGMDEGSIDRFNFLYTYNQQELSKVYPDHDGRTDHNYRRLADKYQVSVETLTTYLLARSAELFLDTIGMEFKNEYVSTIKGQECKLEEEFGRLQQTFFYKPFVSHTKGLIHNITQLCALSVAKMTQNDEDSAETMLKFFEHYDFNIELLIATLTYFSKSETNEVYDLQNVSPQCKLPIANHNIADCREHRNVKEAFKLLTAELVTRDGYNYPSSIGIYNELWMSERGKIREYFPSLVRNQWKTPKELTTAINTITELST